MEHCGNVRDALALFIETNIPEIQQDIDTRLAGVDDAVAKAAAELQKSELPAPGGVAGGFAVLAEPGRTDSY